MLYNTLMYIIGVAFFLIIALLFSNNRSKINWKLIILAFILQNIIFLSIQYVSWVGSVISFLSHGLISLLDLAQHGAQFVFGDFVNKEKFGFVFTLVVVPTIIFFGALISIFYFFGIIQFLIRFLAMLLHKATKLSGVESLIVISDVFLGQAEGPIVIGPYIKNMTKSQLFCAFLAGLANLSGSTLGVYLIFLSNGNPSDSAMFANYLITATFMNAASAIVFAKLLFPETEDITVGTEQDHFSMQSFKQKGANPHGDNLLDGIVNGAITGMKIGVIIVAILVAVIPIIHLIDKLLFISGDVLAVNELIRASSNNVFNGLSLQYLLGQIFRIFAFFMGISWNDTLAVGSLLGQKVAINELIAYIELGKMRTSHIISDHSIFISIFALASFSNFSSIGISMGVFSTLAPSRQKDLSQMAFKALFGAVLAGFLTATIAGFWHNILV